MKKSITNEQVLDAVYDLADICGMRIDEFVGHLQEEYGDPEFDTEGLPEEVVSELEAAKALRKENREGKRKQQHDTEMQKEIEHFRKTFSSSLFSAFGRFRLYRTYCDKVAIDADDTKSTDPRAPLSLICTPY